MKKCKFYYLIVAILMLQCGSKHEEMSNTDLELPRSLLDQLKLPDGFEIKIFAEVNNARSLALSPSGIVFVGNKDEDKVYAIQDVDGDHVADKKWIIASGLTMPNGVAFYKGDLYVGALNQILKFADIENHLESPPKGEVIINDYPKDHHHGWKYIAFGPDDKLYIPVGAPCNICESKQIYASMTRINPDGTDQEIVHQGIRNSVGFAWHPVTEELWFTDNGRDMMGDDVPSCELNRAPQDGLHYGYPYCHAGDIPDPQFNSRPCTDFEKPAWKLGPHVAPLGMTFYTGGLFPKKYLNQIFVAEHGSWNRSQKIGYRVTLVTVEDNTTVVGSETFIEGWLDESSQSAWGRPVDVLQLHDGALLISDDKAGIIYCVSYSKPE